jgi:hypothetical protein
MRTILISILILFLSSVGRGATIHVPADQPTIQAGIDAALESDTVLVAPGTYTGVGNRDLDFHGKNIVVAGSLGLGETVIDCQGSEVEPHRAFVFQSMEGPNAVVVGFSIVNGYATNGGGIKCHASSPSIQGNYIISCTAEHNGGGISCVYGGPRLTANTVWRCAAGDTGGDEGGGISLVYCEDYVVQGNHISQNSAYSGGGIGVFDSFGLIRGNTIAENVAQDGGGIGLCCGSYGTIDTNAVVHNEVDFNGGGIYFNSGSRPDLIDNVLSGNTASLPFGFGGGLACNESSPFVSGNLLDENSAANGGGLALGIGSAPLIQKCTMVSNSATVGSAIYVVTNAALRVDFCIIASNYSGGAVHVESHCNAIVSCSDLHDNVGGNWSGCIAEFGEISSCFSADPMFCDAENRDYHLSVLSPCAPGNNRCQTLIGARGVNCGTFVCGDVDLDGELTEADLEALMQDYYSLTRPPYYPTPVADMNCDGIIDIGDLIRLAGYFYGYGPDPCCAPPPKFIDPSDLGGDRGSPGF